MRRILLTAIIAATLLLFGYFVWPTPWVYYPASAFSTMRVQRWSGRMEVFEPKCGWRSVWAYADRDLGRARMDAHGCPMRTNATTDSATKPYVDPFADVGDMQEVPQH